MDCFREWRLSERQCPLSLETRTSSLPPTWTSYKNNSVFLLKTEKQKIWLLLFQIKCLTRQIWVVSNSSKLFQFFFAFIYLICQQISSNQKASLFSKLPSPSRPFTGEQRVCWPRRSAHVRLPREAEKLQESPGWWEHQLRQTPLQLHPTVSTPCSSAHVCVKYLFLIFSQKYSVAVLLLSASVWCVCMLSGHFFLLFLNTCENGLIHWLTDNEVKQKRVLGSTNKLSKVYYCMEHLSHCYIVVPFVGFEQSS